MPDRLTALEPLAAELDTPAAVLDQLIRDNGITTSRDGGRYSVDGLARERLVVLVAEWRREQRAIPDYRIESGWLVIDTGRHNCAGGTPESSGMHEPTCGLVPVMKVGDLHALVIGGRRMEYGIELSDEPDVMPVRSKADAQRLQRAADRSGNTGRIVVRDVVVTRWRDDVEPPFPPDVTLQTPASNVPAAQHRTEVREMTDEEIAAERLSGSTSWPWLARCLTCGASMLPLLPGEANAWEQGHRSTVPFQPHRAPELEASTETEWAVEWSADQKSTGDDPIEECDNEAQARRIVGDYRADGARVMKRTVTRSSWVQA